MRFRRSVLAALTALALISTIAQAQTVGESGFGPVAASASGFAPQVPVSAFARPASWLDPSRLHFSTTVSVGTGWGGRTDALQVTSLSYRLGAPLAVKVSVGSMIGGQAADRARGMFLEGFQVAYRPLPSVQFNIDYRDVRSPLQYQYWPSNSFGTLGP